MNDPTYVINLQRALEMHVQEQLRIKAELDGYERQANRCRDQLRATEGMIDQVTHELQNAIDLSRRQAHPYDHQLRSDLRDDPRYDRGYEPRREPRYANRSDDRYERQTYRAPEPAYRSPRISGNHPSDIDEAVEHMQADEQGSNVRFADFRIPQAATIVLREANEPLHVSEIFRRLAQGGFEFRGQHQQITLAVSLARSKRFRKVAPGTFELEPEYRVA